MFTPIENPANRLKIAEASTQVSTSAEVFLPHGYAAFFIPINAVRNICSSVPEPCPGVCLEFSLSLSRDSVYPFQSSSVCGGSAHRVDTAGAQVRCPSPKLSPSSLEKQLPAQPQPLWGTLTCHSAGLPLAPPSGSTAIPFPSQGKQPGRARSHFPLLFATCQSTYQSQLHLRILSFRSHFPSRQRGSTTPLPSICFVIASYCCWILQFILHQAVHHSSVLCFSKCFGWHMVWMKTVQDRSTVQYCIEISLKQVRDGGRMAP